MRRLSLGLALGLWAAPATADCVRVGDTITCVDATRGSVITTDRVRVTVNGSIVNIGSAEEFGFCPVSPPTISVGDGSTVVNNGSIVGFGLCGSAVVGGDDLTVVNAGSIITTNTAGFGIAANDRADIAVSGSILTGGLFGYGIGVRHEARIVIDRNASISTIEGGANGIFAERDPTIVNNGTIRVSALGTHGIETVGYMEFTQEGVGFARITNGGIIEANGERSSALKVRADSLVLTNTGAIDAPFSGTTRFSDLARGVEATVARLTLTNSGRIRGGGFGVVALGAATSSLLNSGTIATLDPRGRAVDLTAGQASVVNLGTISGGAVGLAVTGEVQIDNRGLIEATSAPTAANPVAAVTWQGLSQRNRLDNLGVIAARRGGMAILAGGGRDEIFNRGTIIGDVDLGGGDDSFLAFGGSTLTGRLSGGAGNDRLNFFGGGTVDFATDGVENMVMVADDGLLVRGRLDITDTAA
ncbi:MAG: hypothetical protein SFV19_00735, partial [Rhodospirillaceae bacterium]|nr:hypothetical protein [Rhodospirillaceae bacterium]